MNNGVAAAFCALGHHQGLGWLNKDDLNRLLRIDSLRKHSEQQRSKFSEVPYDEADRWLTESNLALPESISSIQPINCVFAEQAAAMVDIRMLFSALVDADFLETEAHFRAPAAGQRYSRPESPPLQPEKALRFLYEYIEKCRRDANAPAQVAAMRDDLLTACRGAARSDPDAFTLSAPTGSGKTLAMLAFALEHAVRNGLRRIVLVVPYLSIIEQTARIYREVFPEEEFGPRYILEHHSLSRSGNDSEDQPNDKQSNHRVGNSGDDDEKVESARLLAENWDAPIMITTSVQYFESLFANRPAACRKLHRLAGSVVLCDEVQTFPVNLAIPTLAALAHLARRHRCTTVFATATQPAFSHFHEEVQKIGGPGWQPHEIVPKELKLFERAKRTSVHWPGRSEKTAWDDLVRKLVGHERVLCIVNMKRHAWELLDRLQDLSGREGLFHLSTNMCPTHREVALREVRERLADDSAGACRLIATQCVEAGVDIDFPTVYRAMGPLEAIAQAAGRCNRHGRLARGEVHVFVPDVGSDGQSKGSLYPSGEYRQAAAWTQCMLDGRQLDSDSLDSPATFAEYYHGLYDLRDFSDSKINEAVRDLDFAETARQYRLIKQQTVNLVVPYDEELFASLCDYAHENGLSGEWIRRARPLAVSVYGTPEQLNNFAAPVRLPDWAQRRLQQDYSDEWFLLAPTADDSYDRELLGLKELPASCTWIA